MGQDGVLRSTLQYYMYNCLHGLQNIFATNNVCLSKVCSFFSFDKAEILLLDLLEYFLSFTVKRTETTVNAIYLQEDSYLFECI